MREVPADVALDPMPEDFTCNIADEPRGLMKATVTINGSKYEVGIRGKDAADSANYLKQSVWQLMELSRLGRTNLMAYASTDRHARR